MSRKKIQKDLAQQKKQALLESLFDPEPLHDVSPEPSSVPSAFSYVDIDFSDFLKTEPNESQTKSEKSQSIESRMRLDLGDLESVPTKDIIPAAPEKHFDTSDVSDVGGWIVIDLGETETAEKPSWSNIRAMPKVRRKKRYGVIPVCDLPDDVPVSGGNLSYEDALEAANDLNSLRDIMES